MESSRTSLASRTHFEIIELGLEASSPQKLPFPRSRTALFFEPVKKLLENVRNLTENLRKPFLCSLIGDRLNNFLKTYFFLLLENTCACVLSPRHWPQAFLSLASRGSVLGMAVLGLGFFVFLALVSSFVFSTPPLQSRFSKKEDYKLESGSMEKEVERVAIKRSFKYQTRLQSAC